MRQPETWNSSLEQIFFAMKHSAPENGREASENPETSTRLFRNAVSSFKSINGTQMWKRAI
jgi:hypothetical protein